MRLKSEKYGGKIIDFYKEPRGTVLAVYKGKPIVRGRTKEKTFELVKRKIIGGKEKIKLHREETDTHYKISSDNTIYVGFNKAKRYNINVDDLIRRRNIIIKRLRSAGVKVKQKDNTDLINRNKYLFRQDIAKYMRIEKEVIKRFNKIYKDGLHVPTSDNEELNVAIKLSYQLNSLNYRSSPISKINEVKNRVGEINRNFDNYKTMIWWEYNIGVYKK